MSHIVEFLELELTSKCNAACPQCPREIPYIKENLNINKNEITLDLIKKWLPREILQRLKVVQFKGGFSEPVIAQDFYEIVRYFIENSTAEIIINTNGSLRKPEFWDDLATLTKNRCKIVFGIDGLEDTHSIYRVNTNYNKVIENATAYINSGGYAVWQFIKFNYNEHQVDIAKELSYKLGFKEFMLINSVRFDSYNNTIFNKNNQELRASNTAPMRDLIQQKAIEQKKQINCQSKEQNWILIDWDGEVFPCCFTVHWKQRFITAGLELDSQKWYKKIVKNQNATNLNHNSIFDILNIFHQFYDNLNQKFLFKQCLTHCSNHDLKY